ncbi:MAG: glycerate kinase [Propioniciclava sp.]
MRLSRGARYLVAPDKFKGTLTAAQAAEAISRGIRQADPTAQITELPFADGGEGTVEAIIHAGGQRHQQSVSGPLGDPVTATWVTHQEVAFLELAEASGLRYVDPDPTSALNADTYGTGQLISAALDAGFRRIIVGAGGSATTDGGFGALRALGARFLDSEGQPVDHPGDIEHIAQLRTDGLHPTLTDSMVEVCADVRSPLLGPQGAAQMFGPQKGADTGAVAQLEARLTHLAKLYATVTPHHEVAAAGGAAGGFAAGAMAVLGAQLRGGVEVLADLLELRDRIQDTDLVVVGEGSLDAQSTFGKTPVGIARIAQSLGVPTIAVVGVTTLTAGALHSQGIQLITSATEVAPGLADALARPAHFVELAAKAAISTCLADLE